MGVFDFLGDIGTAIAKPFADLTGIHASPQGISFGTPFQKFTLGDAAGLAGMFGPGTSFLPTSWGDLGKLGTANFGLGDALGGFGNIGKWNTGDWISKGPGLLAGMGALGGNSGPQAPSMGNPQGMYQGALTNAFNAFSPAGREQAVSTYQGQADRRAKRSGGIRAQQLASRGYGSGAQMGARIGAQNDANQATNEFSMRVNDPQAIANGYLQQARTMSPSMFGAYPLFNAELQGMQYRNEVNRPLNQGEQLFNWAATSLPGIIGFLNQHGQAPAQPSGPVSVPKKYQNVFGGGLDFGG